MKNFCVALFLIMTLGCEEAPELQKENTLWLGQIYEVYEKGEVTKAIDEMNEYLKDYPQDSRAWRILGKIYREDDQYKNALAAYQNAVDVNPVDYKAMTGKGNVYLKQKKYDRAKAEYEKALEANGSYAGAYSCLTVLSLKIHDDENALMYARKGYELDQTNPAMISNLAISYHYNNDFEKRDRFTRRVEQLGYDKMESLQLIYSGEATIRE